MDEVTYREIKLEDADELAEMVGEFWHRNKLEQFRHEYGIVDLAHYMCRVTFAEVAVMNGKLVGIIAVSAAGDNTQKFKEPWGKVFDKHVNKLKEIDKEGYDEALEYAEAEGKVNEQMVSDAWNGQPDELVFLIVKAETRGKGVGSALWKRANDYLASVGVKKAFFYTDSTCDWQYYEHRGMKRLAETTFEQHKQTFLPDRMFLYEYEVK